MNAPSARWTKSVSLCTVEGCTNTRSCYTTDKCPEHGGGPRPPSRNPCRDFEQPLYKMPVVTTVDAAVQCMKRGESVGIDTRGWTHAQRHRVQVYWRLRMAIRSRRRSAILVDDNIEALRVAFREQVASVRNSWRMPVVCAGAEPVIEPFYHRRLIYHPITIDRAQRIARGDERLLTAEDVAESFGKALAAEFIGGRSEFESVPQHEHGETKVGKKPHRWYVFKSPIARETCICVAGRSRFCKAH